RAIRYCRAYAANLRHVSCVSSARPRSSNLPLGCHHPPADTTVIGGSMTEKRPYRLLLALFDTTLLDYWLQIAAALIPDGGEIHLRGLVVVPEDTSLSEGALAARAWRDAFSQI